MIFTVIHIDTGYLNRPNWLLVGYSVYHRVASGLLSRVPAQNVYDRLAIFAPATATARAGRIRLFWMYDDTQHNRESVRTSTGYAYESFSKVYCDRVRFSHPPPSGTPSKWESSAPPPPPGGGGGVRLKLYKVRCPSTRTGRGHLHQNSVMTASTVKITGWPSAPTVGPQWPNKVRNWPRTEEWQQPQTYPYPDGWSTNGWFKRSIMNGVPGGTSAGRNLTPSPTWWEWEHNKWQPGLCNHAVLSGGHGVSIRWHFQSSKTGTRDLKQELRHAERPYWWSELNARTMILPPCC